MRKKLKFETKENLLLAGLRAFLQVICWVSLVLVSAQGQDSGSLNDRGSKSASESNPNSLGQNDSSMGPKKPYRSPSEKFKENNSRTSQFDKRLGLTSRKRDRFDPQAFAQRGHELQNQFYVINGTVSNSNHWDAPESPPSQKLADQNGVNKQWLFWVGAAGLVGATAGVTAFIFLDKAHPSQEPAKVITLTDQP